MHVSTQKTAVIIGGGPAGLTAAFELLKRSNVRPIVLEASNQLGGLARTELYKGNRIDIGGHRFFSKSDRIMQWWLDLLPLEQSIPQDLVIQYQGQSRGVSTTESRSADTPPDNVMLVRPRKSRIYYLRKFFDYPLTVNWRTITNLGLGRMFRASSSYLWAQVFPIRPEVSLQDFLTNRFGRQLYAMFFESYTEKVWGVPCREISAEWGVQRIKGLSVTKLLRHALFRATRGQSLGQKHSETSLIEWFLYPKFGPGQLWTVCAERVREMGGRILLDHIVEHIQWQNDRLCSVMARDATGQLATFQGDYFLSTMPMKDLIANMDPPPPAHVREIAQGLVYRDFITLGVLVNKMRVDEGIDRRPACVKDNWIYIQEPGVKLGRVQVFNNWSPHLVANPETVWLGLEYFCDEGDELWCRADDELLRFGARELAEIGLIDTDQVLDGTVIRTRKAYPAYLGSYSRFDELRSFVDGIGNLFLIGRNGMHRYNNQDHSMLAAMTAVDNICAGRTCKQNIWSVNTEQDYHEQHQAEPQAD